MDEKNAASQTNWKKRSFALDLLGDYKSQRSTVNLKCVQHSWNMKVMGEKLISWFIDEQIWNT